MTPEEARRWEYEHPISAWFVRVLVKLMYGRGRRG